MTWRGTARTVEVLMDNVSDPDRMPTMRFQADPGTIRMIIDYPFDEGNRFPADDVRRVHELKGQLGDENTIVWLPHFLSEDRKADLSTLIVINYLLERDRLTQVTPNLTAEDRHHAKTQLESRRSALTATLREALRRAYGVISATDDDLGPRAAEQVLALARDLDPRIQAGQGMRTAFEGCCGQLLSHRFPAHPDFDPNGRGVTLKLSELDTVLGAVEQAAQDKVGRYEVPRADIPTVKKIANPLKIGIMHEAAFVLSREWPDLLTRKAGAGSRGHRRPAARLDRRGTAWPARARAEPPHRLLRDPGRQGMAAGRAPGRAAQARQDARRPGAPQPGAADPGGVRPRVRPGGRDLPDPAAAGAHRPVGARARRRHPPQRQGTPGGGQGPRRRAGPARGDPRPGRRPPTGR